MKKNTLEKYFSNTLTIQKKTKPVKLLDGSTVYVPKLGYRHMETLRKMKKADDMINFIANDILKGKKVLPVEVDLVLTHLFFFNDESAIKLIEANEINLDELKMTDPVYEFIFDNMKLIFSKPDIYRFNLIELLDTVYVDGEKIELTPELKESILDELYVYELKEVKSAIMQELYIIHNGKKISGFDIMDLDSFKGE